MLMLLTAETDTENTACPSVSSQLLVWRLTSFATEQKIWSFATLLLSSLPCHCQFFTSVYMFLWYIWWNKLTIWSCPQTHQIYWTEIISCGITNEMLFVKVLPGLAITKSNFSSWLFLKAVRKRWEKLNITSENCIISKACLYSTSASQKS